MDFFQHQQRVRRQTLVLLGYFTAALAAVVVAVNLGSWLFTRWFLVAYDRPAGLRSPACLWVTLATVAVIATGSLRRAWQLRDAGDLVLVDGLVQMAEAELLRARCVLLACPMPPLFPGQAERTPA